MPTKKLDTESLVIKVQEGDACAYGELYEIFVDQIYKYVLIKCGNVDAAEDITAETFRKAFVSIKKYKKNNFRAFLYRIAHNTTIDYFRKESKKTNGVDESSLVDEGDSIVTIVEKKQKIERLYTAIQKLPETYREIISLRFIEDLTVKETSIALNKSQVSVRVAQHRATKHLQELLLEK